MLYSKPPLSVEKQIDQLLDRGMSIADKTRAAHYLRHIGYYRLSAYWLPFETPAEAGISRTHRFKPEAQFDHILDLYIFDRKLRLLVMEAIERIEVSVRTQWASGLAILSESAHAHLRRSCFKSGPDLLKDLDKLIRETSRSGETFIRHYLDNYTEPLLPPIWVSTEAMSLGTLSHWVQNTADNRLKQQMAKALGLPTVEILHSVLHLLTLLRNTCAHHGRLWNRRFPHQYPTIKKLADRMILPPSPQAKHLFNHLVILDLLMRTIQPKNSWTSRLSSLLSTRSLQELRWMGFPDDWNARAPWSEISS